jgi:hypothetical protein
MPGKLEIHAPVIGISDKSKIRTAGTIVCTDLLGHLPQNRWFMHAHHQVDLRLQRVY